MCGLPDMLYRRQRSAAYTTLHVYAATDRMTLLPVPTVARGNKRERHVATSASPIRATSSPIRRRHPDCALSHPQVVTGVHAGTDNCAICSQPGGRGHGYLGMTATSGTNVQYCQGGACYPASIPTR